MKTIFSIGRRGKGSFIIISLVILMSSTCKEEKNQPPRMVSVPQFEFISKTTIGKDSSQNINISLDAFYISNEVSNKEYREFTDWAKNHPDEILSKPKEIIIKKNPEPGKTKVWTVPWMVKVSDILPTLIDSNALCKIDKMYKNYFTDKKYDDYPVVGVSRNAAEYYCVWLIRLEEEISVLRKGQTTPSGMRAPEKMIMGISPSYGYYRIPLEMEWEYVSKQPYRNSPVNDHNIHKVNEGSTNRWGIIHLHDNVSEWVTSPDDTLAISRGDNWRNSEGLTDRYRMHPDSSNGWTGFRIARTFKPEKINDHKKK